MMSHDHSKVCLRLAERCDASLAICRKLAAEIEALTVLSALSVAGPDILARIALDYEHLAEQFRDFMHDGTKAVVEHDDEDKPVAMAA